MIEFKLINETSNTHAEIYSNPTLHIIVKNNDNIMLNYHYINRWIIIIIIIRHYVVNNELFN